jgi:hypothetical protein
MDLATAAAVEIGTSFPLIAVAFTMAIKKREPEFRFSEAATYAERNGTRFVMAKAILER